MSKVRVGILGCGPRGNSQAQAWQKLPHVELAALCDLNEERLHATGERFGVKNLYTSYEEMFAREDLLIVNVPARADWHYPLAMAVLEHGVSTIVEKPITIDLQLADKLVETARAQGVRLAVHHQLSCGPIQHKAKSLIAEGAIGQLRCIRAYGKGYYGGFGMMETGTHALDQMRNFGGEVEWVQARVTVRGRDITAADVAQAPRGLGLVAGDTSVAYYAFKNGVYGIGEFFHRQKMDSRAYGTDLIGTDGMICIRSGTGSGLYLQRDPVWHPMHSTAPWEEIQLSEEDCRVPGTDLSSADAQVWMAQEMINAVQQKREHPCSGEAARTVLEMIVGCYASQMSGGRVSLPLQDRVHPLQRLCEAAGVPTPPFKFWKDAEYLAAEQERLDAQR
jgi:predicted dehydrogenase